MGERVVLRAEGLGKTYSDGPEKTVALDGVNLSLSRGQLLVVYGPSGSGKTTLLSLLGGLDRPTSGRVYWDGVEVSGLDERRLSRLRRSTVGFVFQNYNLVEELTVMENVGLPMLFDGKGRVEMEERCVGLLGQMGLAEKTKVRPSRLSAGEQQRVAVARALANRPRLVLMDEPTGNLDQDNSRALMGLVERIISEDSVTFVIATHNLDIVKTAALRVFLRAGRITEEPPTQP